MNSLAVSGRLFPKMLYSLLLGEFLHCFQDSLSSEDSTIKSLHSLEGIIISSIPCAPAAGLSHLTVQLQSFFKVGTAWHLISAQEYLSHWIDNETWLHKHWLTPYLIYYLWILLCSSLMVKYLIVMTPTETLSHLLQNCNQGHKEVKVRIRSLLLDSW